MDSEKAFVEQIRNLVNEKEALQQRENQVKIALVN